MSCFARPTITLAIGVICITSATSAMAQFRFSGSKAKFKQQSNPVLRTPNVRKPSSSGNAVNRFSRLPGNSRQNIGQPKFQSPNRSKPIGRPSGNLPTINTSPPWNLSPNRLNPHAAPSRKPKSAIDLGRFGHRKPQTENKGPSRNPQIRTPQNTIGNLKIPNRKFPPAKTSPFLQRPNGVANVTKKPIAQLGSGKKLEGIKLFEGLVNKQGKNKLAPVKLDKFNGKLAAIMKPANLKIHPVQHQNAKQFAVKKLALQPKCHWWIDFVIGCNWQWNHCHWWDHCYQPGYWQCWTPCHYQVVYCPPAPGYVSTSWYFGIDCILIPDMAAFGIQEVKPNSPAAFAGLKPGDLIISINGYGIDDESVLANAIRTSGGHLELGIIRDGNEQPVIVKVALLQIQKLSY